MVLESFCAGLISGVYCAFLRGMLLQFGMKSWWEMASTYMYILIVVPGAIYQLKLLNYAMALYNQAEIGPIYLSSIIMCHLLSGAVILDEADIYTDMELVLLFGFSLFCIAGIYVIAKKPKFPCYRDRPVYCCGRQTNYEVEESPA